MLIDGVNNAGAMPTLDAMVRFTAQRQNLIAHNIANVSTPDFIQTDVSVSSFQANLRDAVEERRDRSDGAFGSLQIRSTNEVRVGRRGGLELTPQTARPGVLAHDRNNRDIERLMQDLVENVGAFRTATELLNQQTGMLRRAMSEQAG